MKIVALVEVHPLSGEPSFITARFSGNLGEFDLPLSEEQARIVLENSVGTTSPTAQEEYEDLDDTEDPGQEFYGQEEYSHSPIHSMGNTFPNLDEDALVLPASPQGGLSHEYYDDEL